jgi:hypothetical protein
MSWYWWIAIVFVGVVVIFYTAFLVDIERLYRRRKKLFANLIRKEVK